MPIKRFRARSLAAVAAAMAAGLLLAACSSSPSSSSGTTTGSSKAALPVLTVAVDSDEVTPIPNGIIQLGVQTGAFEKVGVDVKLVSLEGTPQVVQALVAGKVDVANVDSQDAITLVAKKEEANVRAFVSNGAYSDYVLVTRSNITSFSQLKGKSFANETPGSEPDLMLKELEAENGMSVGSISSISIGSPAQRLLAVVKGKADATLVSAGQWESLTSSQATCCRLLYNQAQFLKAVPVESKLDIATESTLTTKKAAIGDFIKAVLSMSREYYADPVLWAKQVASTRKDLSQAALTAGAKTAGFEEQWCVNGCMNPTILSSTSAFYYGSPSMDGVPKISLSAWVDTTLLHQILTSVGTFSATDAP